MIEIVYGIQAGDLIFIMLSLLIGLRSILRIFNFYRLIRNQDYLVLTGMFIRRESVPFKKHSRLLARNQVKRSGDACNTTESYHYFKNMNVTNIHDVEYMVLYNGSKTLETLERLTSLNLDRLHYRPKDLNGKIKKFLK